MAVRSGAADGCRPRAYAQPVGGRGVQALLPTRPATAGQPPSVQMGPGRGRPTPHSQQAARLGIRSDQLPRAAGGAQLDHISPVADGGRQAVLAFLTECGLHMYATRLLDNGFDEMETLHELVDVDISDLRQMGIHPSHAARLQRVLLELRQGDGVDQQGEGRGGAVVAFLEEHGLGQYAAALFAGGFDEMETLCDADDVDLKDLGLPRGHALKLRRHIREHQIDSVAALPPAQRRPGRSVVHRFEATEAMTGDVQRSWEKVQELGTAVVGERIYKAFFEIVPEAAECFPIHVRMKYKEWTAEEGEEGSDLANSAALGKLFGKVVNAIGCCVAGLRDVSRLVPLLSSLGARHISYGVEYSFWPALGQAMNKTLRETLGEDFTPEVENAWNVVYGFMSSIMVESLRQSREAAAAAERACDRESSKSWHNSTIGDEIRGLEDTESVAGLSIASWSRLTADSEMVACPL